jgi:SAM-dependent methyltransferase
VSLPANRYGDIPKTEVHRYIPAGAAKFLDVGCWRGAFGAAVKAQRPGAIVWGLEKDEAAAQVAAERLDHVIIGSFPDDRPDEQFDVVSFIDVIEHLSDPWDALQKTHNLLRPGGVVLALIPNVRHISVTSPLLLRGRWDYVDAGILDRTHLRFFTKATMRDLFLATGYRLTSLEATNVQDIGGPTGLLLRMLGQRSIDLRAVHYTAVAKSALPR